MYKKARLNIRLTEDQHRKVKRVARLETKARRERVLPSQVFREIGMQAIDLRLAELDPPLDVAS